MKSRTIIFAGAGASKAVNPKQFPTTVEFFEKLPEKIRGNPYFLFVLDYINAAEQLDQVDIEHVLWALQEFYKLFDSFQHGHGPAGYAFKHNILHLVNKGYNFGHLQASNAQIAGQLKSLIDQINEQVYAFYADEPSKKSLEDNWFELIEWAKGRSDRLDIFTTNYDGIIEAALNYLDGDETSRIECGIAGRKRQRLDLDFWNEDDKPDHVLLTKLHGSLDWKYSGENIAVGDAVFTGDHKKHAIIYPGFKGVDSAKFFTVFHEYLRRSCYNADLVIFVGFAFRDDHINRIFSDALARDAHVVSINPDIRAVFPVSRINTEYLHEGFSKASISKVL